MCVPTLLEAGACSAASDETDYENRVGGGIVVVCSASLASTGRGRLVKQNWNRRPKQTRSMQINTASIVDNIKT